MNKALSEENHLRVSVVVPAFNCADTIPKTLNAILDQNHFDKNNLEVIAVDDGSDDDTAETIRKFPVRYLFQRNAGPAKARNTGWRASKADIICFTDSDCIPDRHWVYNLTNKFVSEDIGAVAGSYGIANSHKILADCIHEEIIQRHLNMPEFIRAFGSYNVAIRRGILEKVGGFEEAYRYASGEDNDLSYKIIRAGYKIYFCKDAIVFHYHQENILKYLREQYRHGVWRMKLYRAHPEMMRGDDYTNWKDIIEPPLALFSVSLLPFLSLLGLRNIFLACFSFYCFMQLPMALRICLRKKNIKFMYLAVVTYVRGFARAFGMLAGIIGK